ncbi:MAG: hypothetical protein K2Y32_14250 [Candidatus Obscuribacterales bacterium]|nr:hypothetical protein [Candidatus Obscuribacterales bacterium]
MNSRNATKRKTHAGCLTKLTATIFCLSAPLGQAQGQTPSDSKTSPYQIGIEQNVQAQSSSKYRLKRASGAITENGLSSNSQSSLLRGQVDDLAKLKHYKLEVIIDKSMSMRHQDCPGNQSRWQWCLKQAENLGDEIARLRPGGITISTFAGQFEVHRDVTGKDIAAIFADTKLSLGTRLSLPLRNRIEEYLAKARTSPKPQEPLLLAVITDGAPAPKIEPYLVSDLLIKTSKRLKNGGEIKLVFLQVGANSNKGRKFLNFLDNKLVDNGANFDLVSTVSFEELMQTGLAAALSNSLASD